MRRFVASRPYFAGAIVFHALLALLLLNVAAFDARKSAQVAAAEAARSAQRVAQTQARDLQRRVERMEAIRAELDPTARPLPPSTGDAFPAALAERAQALSDAIDAAERETRESSSAAMASHTSRSSSTRSSV